jgi:large subunit ribosomal protein L31
MQADVHPQYYVTQVTCGCGNSFTTRSTRKELKLDICSACHPFYTGKLKFVDTAGRIQEQVRQGRLRQPGSGQARRG